MGQGKIVAIVPAAGRGKRFGEQKNKPFYPLMGKPLLIWALEMLQGVEEIAEIIPVLKEDDLITCGELIERYNITKVKRIVPGGKERQDSVYNAIKIIDDKTSVVLIHDGARPLADKDLIRRSIAELKDYDGVVVGMPVKDTIKAVSTQKSEDRSQGTDKKESDVIVQKTLDRNVLWAIQTPQVFPFQKIKDAYIKAMADKYYATDDAALVERYKGRIKVIIGSCMNIKITTPEDIYIAEALLKASTKSEMLNPKQ